MFILKKIRVLGLWWLTIFQLYRDGQFLVVEETGVPGENHCPVVSHWQTLSHIVVSNTPRLSGIWTHNVIYLKKQKHISKDRIQASWSEHYKYLMHHSDWLYSVRVQNSRSKVYNHMAWLNDFRCSSLKLVAEIFITINKMP